jgi:hypothetical protein
MDDSHRAWRGPGAEDTEQVFVGMVAGLSVDMPATVTGGSADQGDVRLEVWPPQIEPAARLLATTATRPLAAGEEVDVWDGRHVLTADGAGIRWSGHRSASGLTLGTLWVPVGTVTAVLCHPEHPDLRIGAGVYVLRCQHRARPRRPAPGPALSWVGVRD